MTSRIIDWCINHIVNHNHRTTTEMQRNPAMQTSKPPAQPPLPTALPPKHSPPRPSQLVRQADTPQTQPPKVEVNVTPELRLAASKALHSLAVTARAYGLVLYSEEHKDLYIADVAVFLAAGILHEVQLILQGADRAVLSKVTIQFGQEAKPVHSAASGTEVPLVSGVAAGELRVSWKNGLTASVVQQAFAGLLKLNWSPAAPLHCPAGGEEFRAKAHARKTGGRQEAQIFCASSARQTLRITRTGNKGYAFADCDNLKMRGIFIDKREVDPALLPLTVGMQLRAHLVQLPSGIQARRVSTI